MEILEENETNWLVMTPEGGTDTKTKASDLNKLLYGHDLFGLLDRGTEVWMNDGLEEEPKVTIIPGDDENYTLRLEGAPDLILGAHHKTDLIEAMSEMFEKSDGESVSPLLKLYDDIREDMIRDEVVEPFAKVFGDKVEKRDDGWFINGHLLLTFEGEFYHPSTTSKQRSGNSVMLTGSSAEAYSFTVRSPEDSMSRNVSFDGVEYRLTDKEMDFIARVVWAVENTPDKT